MIMNVIEPGSPVIIGGDIPAMVIATTLFPKGLVSCRVVWWDGRQRREETLGPEEIRTSKASFALVKTLDEAPR